MFRIRRFQFRTATIPDFTSCQYINANRFFTSFLPAFYPFRVGYERDPVMPDRAGSLSRLGDGQRRNARLSKKRVGEWYKIMH